MHKYKWCALIGLSLLSFTAFLDFTIVSTALPFIQRDMHAAVSSLQWVTNIFGMVLCMFMIVYGKFGDTFGRRKMYYIAFVFFLVAAIGAGLSHSMGWLIFFRGIQGFAGAGIFTLGVALLPLAFPEDEQTKAIGVFSAFNGVGLAIGPFLGGLLITYLSWRWVFFINVPIIIIGFLCCVFTLRESKRQHGLSIDWWGFIFLVIGLGCSIYGLIRGQQSAWDNAAWICLAIGIISLLILVFVESKVESPLLDLSVFKSTHATLAIITCILASLVTYVLLFFDPLYLSFIRGETAIIIGVVLLAVPIMQVLVSVFLTRLINTIGIFNLMVFGAFAGLVASVMHAYFGAGSSTIFVIVALAIMGYTWGIANAGSITAVIQALPAEKVGSSIGMLFTCWNLFGAVFLALGTLIYHAKEKSAAIAYLSGQNLDLGMSHGLAFGRAMKDPGNAQSILSGVSHSDQLMRALKVGFLSGFHWVAWSSAIVMLVGLLLGFVLLKKSK